MDINISTGEEGDEEEEFLSLKLAIVENHDHDHGGQKKRKRIRRSSSKTPPSPLLLKWDLNQSYNKNNVMNEVKFFGVLDHDKRKQICLNNKQFENKNKNNNVLQEEEEEDQDNNKGLHLIHSLLVSATSINNGDFDLAIENISELYKNVSIFGTNSNSLQRVVSYFADALISRLLLLHFTITEADQKSYPFYDTIIPKQEQEQEQEYLLAFTEFYKVSPFHQFSHFTANQIIMETYLSSSSCPNCLHVIDFDLCFGFQWPSLMQSLSDHHLATATRMSTSTSTSSIDRICKLKITGFGKTLEELQETEARLVSFAKGFRNLVFEFHGALLFSSSDADLEKNLLERIIVKRNETVVVNLVLFDQLSSNVSSSFETLLIKCVRRLNPAVVVTVEKGGGNKKRSPQNFLSRFMESLYYFAAIFDSLDDSLPLDSKKRLNIEKNYLGKEIKNLMMMMNMNNDNNGGGIRRILMENYGFVKKKMSNKTVIQAKLLLKIRSYNGNNNYNNINGGFRVFEKDEGKAISLGWDDRCLITASAWTCA